MRAVLLALTLSCALGAHSQQADWSAVEKAMGRQGKPLAGGVIRFGMPRADLKVTLQGVTLQPAFALGSWAAFGGDPKRAMLMGDLVVTVSEMPQVISKLKAGGVEISAIHNHVVGETPRVMYIHIGGHGDAVEMARALHNALAATGTPREAPAASAGAKSPLDRAAIEKAMGKQGTVAGEVLQFSFARPEQIREEGMEVPATMGTSTSINFEPAAQGQVATTGDYVLVGEEVNKVISSLTSNGVAVTALHNHMLNDTPRLFFLHFWGVGEPAKIVSAVRKALDQTASGKPAK
ncbi:MAG TPA: DUF1259 domain-containing protein [Terriglobales bacterium]|nr:DUF1259 domain-containing protein [Terriglobales bacterium]